MFERKIRAKIIRQNCVSLTNIRNICNSQENQIVKPRIQSAMFSNDVWFLLLITITVALLAREGVEALLLVEIDPCQQQSHGQEDENCDLEGGEKVGYGVAVLLHHVVQLLQDRGHHQPPQTAEEQAQHYRDQNLGVGGLEVGGDKTRSEVRGGDNVDQTGHQHPIEIEPELLLQEILTRVLNCDYMCLCLHLL